MEGAPRVWPVFVAFATVLVVLLVSSTILVVGLTVVLHGASSVTDPKALESVGFHPIGLLVSFALSSSILAAASLLGARLSPVAIKERLRLTRGRFGALDVFLATLTAMALGTVFGAASMMLGLREGSTLEEIEKAVAAMSGTAIIPIAILGALGPGIGEELFFRGYMETRLTRRFGRVAGVGVAATAFGLIHFAPLHMAYALLLGIFLGWLAARFDTIVLGIATHILNNALAFSLMWLVPSTPTDAGNVLAIGIGCVVCVGAILLLAKRSARAPLDPIAELPGNGS